MSITEKQRGPEVGVQVIWLLHGIAFTYWLDFGFTRLNSQVSWVSSASRSCDSMTLLIATRDSLLAFKYSLY
jgi:hypothetical protein